MTQPFDPLDVLNEGQPLPATRPPAAARPAAPTDVRGSEVVKSRLAASAGPFMCASCHARTVGRESIRGQRWLEWCLWLFFLWPLAVCYTIWRRYPPRRQCTVCGGFDLVRA